MDKLVKEIYGKNIKNLEIATSYKYITLCDNQAAIAMSKDLSANARTKHLDIRRTFVWNNVNNGLIDLQYVNTKNNLADLFTKAQSRNRLGKLMLNQELC